MTTVLLDDLAQRIRQQEAQLQDLRRELETRQQQLSQLSQRREQLLTQLQQVDAEIAGITSGAPGARSGGVKQSASKSARTVVIGRQPNGNGAAARPAGEPRPRGTRGTSQGRSDSRADQPTLTDLIVSLLREAGRPLTVKELGQELKRRRFQSKSRNFSKMLGVRTRELKLKGILRRAVGQPGYVLAQSTSNKKHKGAQPLHRKTRPQQTVKQRPLREVLIQILKKSTRPLTGSELAAEALKAGYHSTSKNFVDVVWVAMSSLKNVERVPNQGYRLKKR
jgi:hypothetical protein